MVVFSAIYVPWLTLSGGHFSVMNFFVWFACLWLIFPLGALLGGSILNRLRGLSLSGVAMAGLGIGAVSGLLLALALFLFLGSSDLMGLMRGGSPGYVLSVSQALGKLAWHFGGSVGPLTMGIVFMWAIWRKADEPSLQAGELVSVEEPRVRLRLGLRHLAAWGLLAGLMAVATAALALTDFRNVRSLALFFIGGGGVPVLGPWIGGTHPVDRGHPVSFAAQSPSACGDVMLVRVYHRPAFLAGRRTILGRLVHGLRQRRERALGPWLEPEAGDTTDNGEEGRRVLQNRREGRIHHSRCTIQNSPSWPGWWRGRFLQGGCSRR
jgi:hypothetical protein